MKNLKYDFVSALITMLTYKALDKITVTDIVNTCGVSRQAFYYHFNDIYDIVEWIFSEETKKALSNHQNIDTWQIGYINLLNWLKGNKSLVINTYKSIQRDYIEIFMNSVLLDYIKPVVNEQSKGLNVKEIQKDFIAKFYTLSFNSIALDWIKNGMKENTKDIVNNIEIIIKGDFQKALENMHNDNNK